MYQRYKDRERFELNDEITKIGEVHMDKVDFKDFSSNFDKADTDRVRRHVNIYDEEL